jgi:hypothetical protein
MRIERFSIGEIKKNLGEIDNEELLDVSTQFNRLLHILEFNQQMLLPYRKTQNTALFLQKKDIPSRKMPELSSPETMEVVPVYEDDEEEMRDIPLGTLVLADSPEPMTDEPDTNVFSYLTGIDEKFQALRVALFQTKLKDLGKE